MVWKVLPIAGGLTAGASVKLYRCALPLSRRFAPPSPAEGEGDDILSPTFYARTISSGVSHLAAMRVATEPSTAVLKPP